MGSPELTKADLAKLLTFIEIAQALMALSGPELKSKIEALLMPAVPAEKES